MSVIVEFTIPADNFELGSALCVEPGTTIKLETLVPLGKEPIPLFRVQGPSNDTFLKAVNRHPSVEAATKVDGFKDQTLFKLEWDSSTDMLINGIKTWDGGIHSAIGRVNDWEFKLRFLTHEQLSSFSSYCRDSDMNLSVNRLYQPSEYECAPSNHLTDPQEEALKKAVEQGYYSIPRGCSTKSLGEDLDISDQAVTERLRRAIVALSISKVDSIETDQ